RTCAERINLQLHVEPRAAGREQRRRVAAIPLGAGARGAAAVRLAPRVADHGGTRDSLAPRDDRLPADGVDGEGDGVRGWVGGVDAGKAERVADDLGLPGVVIA